MRTVLVPVSTAVTPVTTAVNAPPTVLVARLVHAPIRLSAPCKFKVRSVAEVLCGKVTANVLETTIVCKHAVDDTFVGLMPYAYFRRLGIPVLSGSAQSAAVPPLVVVPKY